MTATQRMAAQELIARGDISWLLHPAQLQMMEWLDQHPREVAVLCINRQFGKTFALLAYCIAYAMSHPRTMTLFMAPHLDHLDAILMPRVNQIFSFLRDDQIPSRRKYAWHFKNGSILQIDGIAVGRGARVRGQSVHLCVLDEAREVPELQNVVESHIAPMFSTTQGRLIISSTPPDSPSHAFSDFFIREALARGDFYHATYMTNPLLPTARLRYLMNVLHPGGENNVTFRREYMADWTVSDPELRVVREWNETENDEFFETYTGPGTQIVRPYTAMDYAHADPCGLLSGYFDPSAGCMIVMEEHFQRHMTTNDVGARIAEMERKVLAQIPRRMDFIRIMDVDPLLMNDLYQNFHLRFEPAVKTNSNIAMLNRLRVVVAEGKLRVHPRCVQLKFQLRNGVFNPKLTDYLRTDRTGHLDLVDAAKYLVLGARWRELLHESPQNRMLRHNEIRIGGFVGENFKSGLINRPV